MRNLGFSQNLFLVYYVFEEFKLVIVSFYILFINFSGLLWIECKQIYHSGVRVYLLDIYNFIDFTVLSLYLASYVLRFLVDHWIKDADQYFKGVTSCREYLHNHNYSNFTDFISMLRDDNTNLPKSYFMLACEYLFKLDLF